MSYLGRVDTFKCDECEEVVHVHEPPSGWMWYRDGEGKVAHQCVACHVKKPHPDALRMGVASKFAKGNP